ncbi:TPA: Na+/H+ antiporter, partial [Vibrio alginolyticus]|nr:Na+/H+ antiporter [Vibrio alginolyticus]
MFFIIVSILVSGLLSKALPFDIPNPILQIISGIIISYFFDDGIELEPHSFLFLFIPPLLFLDGWRISKKVLKEEWINISLLSVGLVIFTMFSLGFFIHFIAPSIPLLVALALAAILSPTDPVAVSGITKNLSMPRRVLSILEGESLFNDATGLVAFRVSMLVFVTGSFSIYETMFNFFWVVFSGVLIGFIITKSLCFLRKKFTDKHGEDINLEVIFSLLLPYVSYAIAEFFDASGVLSAVVSGIVISKIEFKDSSLPMTRMRRTAVWDTLQYCLNGAIFVLLGEQIPDIVLSLNMIKDEAGYSNVFDAIYISFVIFIALLLIRFSWSCMFLNLPIYRHERLKSLNFYEVMLLSVSGIRGAVTLAGVLSFPLLLPSGDTFPGRNLSILIATLIIVIGIVFSSIIIPILLKRKIEFNNKTLDINYREKFISQKINEILTSKLEKTFLNLAIESPSLEKKEFYKVADNYIAELQKSFDIYSHKDVKFSHETEVKIKRVLIELVRESIYELENEHQISDSVARKIIRRLDFHDVAFN